MAGPVIEQGDIFFFYRQKVDATGVGGLEDVQRFFVLLAAERPRRSYRLLMLGRKRLPDTSGTGSDRRNGSQVVAVAKQADRIRRELLAFSYGTKTRGERHVEAAVPVGEGRYQLVRVGRQAQLAYSLELPEEPGEAQHAFGIEREASYVLSVRNPTLTVGPRGAPAPRWPPELLEPFGQRRWLPLDDPRFLDVPGAQLPWIGAHHDDLHRIGIEIPVEDETLETAELTRELQLELEETSPLEAGEFPDPPHPTLPLRHRCPICAEGFARPSQLRQHLANAHPPRAPSASDLEHAIHGASFPARRAGLVRQARRGEGRARPAPSAVGSSPEVWMRTVVAVLVGLSLLACSGVEVPPPPAPAPSAPPAPEPPRAAEPQLPPLPERGEDRPTDCEVDLERLTPLLKLRQPAGRAPARMEQKKGAVVERVALDDGTIVRLARHGCDHYAETWEIAPVPPDRDPREAAIEHLGRLVIVSGEQPPIVEVLKRAPGIGEDGGFACGDAVCGIRAEGGVVTVLFDLAL